MHGIESKRRNRPVAETMAIFDEMIAGTEEGQKNCIRYKMDMQVGPGPRCMDCPTPRAYASIYSERAGRRPRAVWVGRGAGRGRPAGATGRRPHPLPASRPRHPPEPQQGAARPRVLPLQRDAPLAHGARVQGAGAARQAGAAHAYLRSGLTHQHAASLPGCVSACKHHSVPPCADQQCEDWDRRNHNSRPRRRLSPGVPHL